MLSAAQPMLTDTKRSQSLHGGSVALAIRRLLLHAARLAVLTDGLNEDLNPAEFGLHIFKNNFLWNRKKEGQEVFCLSNVSIKINIIVIKLRSLSQNPIMLKKIIAKIL